MYKQYHPTLYNEFDPLFLKENHHYRKEAVEETAKLSVVLDANTLNLCHCDCFSKCDLISEGHNPQFPTNKRILEIEHWF